MLHSLKPDMMFFVAKFWFLKSNTFDTAVQMYRVTAFFHPDDDTYGYARNKLIKIACC